MEENRIIMKYFVSRQENNKLVLVAASYGQECFFM